MTTACEKTVAALKEKLIEQDEFIQKIASATLVPAVVIEKTKDAMLVAAGSRMLQTFPLKGADVGSTVMIHPETHQPVKLSPFKTRLGSPCTVEGVMPDGRIEVLAHGDKRIVVRSSALKNVAIEPGSTALLDDGDMVLMELVAPPKAETTNHTRVQWSQIGGNERAKRELREAVEMIRGDSSIFSAYGAKAPKGVLLYGPPGCGKTMLGKAVATELGSDAFIYVKAPELLNMYVGATEERIRSLFRSARDHKQRTGQTAVIFIDEADAILQERSASAYGGNMEKTIVPSFLTEMDGISESAAMVILATNRPDTLDPAIIRDGRIDARILIDRPGQKEVNDIFQINLSGLPTSGCDMHGIAEHATEVIFTTPTLKSRVSGAMVAAVVERAKRAAVRRDIALGKVTGITMVDITTALNEGE